MDNNVVINAPTPIKFDPQQFVTVGQLDAKRENVCPGSNIAVSNMTLTMKTDAVQAHEPKKAQVLSTEAQMFKDSIGTGHVLVKSIRDPNVTKTIFIDNNTIKRSIGKENLFVDVNGVKLRTLKLDANVKIDPDLMRVEENNDTVGSMGLRNV